MWTVSILKENWFYQDSGSKMYSNLKIVFPTSQPINSLVLILKLFNRFTLFTTIETVISYT